MKIISNDIKCYFFLLLKETKKNVLGNLLVTSWAETDLSVAHFLLEK